MHWRRKWQPTPVFLLTESQGRGSLIGCRMGSHRVGLDWSDLAAATDCYFVLFMPLSPCQPLWVEVPSSFALWFHINPPLLTAFIYFFKKMYLFSFGCAGSSLLHRPFFRCGKWGLLSSCGAHGSHRGGFFWLQDVGSVVAAPGLYSTDSVVVVPGLICFTACGIYPDQGLNPCLLHW